MLWYIDTDFERKETMSDYLPDPITDRQTGSFYIQCGLEIGTISVIPPF